MKEQDLATRHAIHDVVFDRDVIDGSPMGDGIMDSTGVPSADPPPRMEAQQQAAWNATQQDYPRDVLVPQLVAAQAAATPDAVALVAQSRGARTVLTYRELDARANQVAHHLRALGVGPDILVGLCLERSAALVVGALGIMRAGGAYVPLDPAYPPERLAFMLQDAQTPVLVTQQHLAARLPAGPWRVVALNAAGAAPQAGGGGRKTEEGGRRKAEEAAGLHPSSASRLPPSVLRPAHLAYVIYTSGSTGQPKGVQITHDSLLNLVFWHQRAFAVTAGDRATQVASPGFDAAVWELWPYLTAGASVYFPDEETRVAPAALRDWLVAQEITISFLPTPLAERVMALEWPATTALRVLLTGGDALHRYPSPTVPFTLINNYGPTENTVVATSGPVPALERPEGPPSIGRPIANTQVYILDERLQPVPSGVPGELHIGGAGLARGYLNRPELTAEKFIPDPFTAVPGARLYKTGDWACYLPDGQIAFLGRIDEQIKIRGYRIEPGEIVTALDQHPAVQASVVVAREDTPGDKRLVAYLVPAVGPRPTASALRAFLATQVPDYMVPATFVCLDVLPLTPNGKVDRAALPAPDATNTVQDDTFTAPRTPVEERLAGIVAPLLGMHQVGVYDNFFLLGVHSLLGAQVIARVADTFDVDLPLHALFDAPTVAELAIEIEYLMLARLEAMSDDEAQRLLA